ncbi:unnamed protein product [Phytomonas sp. EM1]|nr:unnamed protein product [Phytomonas sp. EM1]|eukprot:CCW64989.1 unnamed protein product [Phytomonas sp. isolate EM1]
MRLLSSKRTQRCCLVAVTGFSGSGKTTVAHLLGRQLRSPFHPISLDDFFDASRCEALGTFDDFRTIHFGNFVRSMRELKAFLSVQATKGENGEGGSPRLSWKVELLARQPWVARYLVAAATEEPDDDAVSGDSSLLAHEEEGRRWRRATTPHGDSSSSSSDEKEEREREGGERILYVVCEGISMFCDGAVLGLSGREGEGEEKGALFDVHIAVGCDFEAACLRRFARTPRRPNHPRDPLPRIRKLIAARTEARRRELHAFLTAAVDVGGDFSPVEAAREARVVWERLLRVEGPFFPPELPVAGTRFADFWRRRYQPPHTEAGMDWAVLSPDVEASVVAAMQASAAQQWEEQLEVYFKFRYWFFFEVLYYHHLFKPLEAFNLSLYAAMAVHRGARTMRMLEIDNRGQSNLAEVEKQVEGVAGQIRSHCLSIR